MRKELWAEYRQTWKELARKTNEMLELSDTGLAAAASAEVARARLEHNAARDLLARHLGRKVALPVSAAEHEHGTRRTARLLWEFSGKTRNTAEADWHRAEKLVRAASA